MQITVYSTPGCTQCRSTYKALDQAGTQYEVVDITEDPSAFEFVLGLGHRGAPVVVVSGADNVLNQSHWSGHRPDLLRELTAAIG